MLAQDFFLCGERAGYEGLRLEVGGNRWGWPLRIMGDSRGGALAEIRTAKSCTTATKYMPSSVPLKVSARLILARFI